MTRLDAFLKTNDLKVSKVAREAGISRQHLFRLRKGRAEATILTALRIRDACGRLLLRRVTLAEIFEVE